METEKECVEKELIKNKKKKREANQYWEEMINRFEFL